MISVLFPSTGRPERARKCLEALRDTAGDHELEVVAAVDADEDTRNRITGLVDVMLYSDTYRGNSVAWNDCLAACGGDPVVFAADDLVWYPGWLDKSLETLADFDDGWGLVGFNDGHWREDLSTHYLMSRRFIVEVLGGVVAWPFYKHSHNDLEVNERAKRAGRYAWCEEAVVRHEHWIFGDRPQDDTDLIGLEDHAKAKEMFESRRAAGFPNVGVPVIQA